MAAPKKTLTKRFITSALLDLMREQPYDSISITAITSRAQVARATFYRNYEDKEDIIRQYLLRILYHINDRTSTFESNWLDEFFKFAVTKKWFFDLLFSENLSYLLLEQLTVFWTEELSCSTIPYVTECLTYGLYGLFSAWVRNGMVETPEEICRVYHALIPKQV